MHAGTELVVEGFPRTASSFFYHAFCVAQNRPVEVAYHVHQPAHVLQAIRMNIPTVVLIRNPRDAVASLRVREPYLHTGLLLARYRMFYQTLLAVRGRLVIADFTEVTEDPGAVMQAINKKFNTEFTPFTSSSPNTTLVEEQLKQRHYEYGGTALTSYQPNEEKEAAKQEIDFSKYARRLAECESLYREFSSKN